MLIIILSLCNQFQHLCTVGSLLTFSIGRVTCQQFAHNFYAKSILSFFPYGYLIDSILITQLHVRQNRIYRVKIQRIQINLELKILNRKCYRVISVGELLYMSNAITWCLQNDSVLSPIPAENDNFFTFTFGAFFFQFSRAFWLSISFQAHDIPNYK